MKNTFKVVIVVLLVGLVAAACNMPTISIGYPTTAVTPNTTLTALFDTSKDIPPTVTPVFVVITNTPAPTDIPTNTAVPTSTTAPTATATSVPTQIVYYYPNNNQQYYQPGYQQPGNQPGYQQPGYQPGHQPNPPTQPNYGSAMKAGYINFSPTIDGSWSEWKDYTTQYPIDNIVFGRNNWTGPDDLEGSYAAAWDYNYLYIGVKVHDDVYAQHATGADLYKGDSIEILLDKDESGDYYSQSLNADDYQLGISGGNASAGIAPEAYLWFPSSSAGSKSVAIGYGTETGIWRIEAAIPWSVFGINPANGMRLGFAVSISDNDDTTQNVQQTMASTSANRVLTNPYTWGELVLTK